MTSKITIPNHMKAECRRSKGGDTFLRSYLCFLKQDLPIARLYVAALVDITDSRIEVTSK
jgi:hypothetical protein